MSAQDAVAVAERLLALVKDLAAAPAQSKDAYTGALDVQRTCDELLRTVVGPLEYTVLIGESCQESAALHFVTQLGVADIIGEGTASLADLSERTGADARFLGVVMSCMLGRGYFVQESPNVYKNNALSEVLREAHPSSLKGAIGFVCDEGYNAASKLQEAAKSHGQASGSKLAFGFQGTVFDWMAAPEHAWRNERLGRAMKQLHMMANANVPADFEWNKLRGPVVDCGGGIGALEMALLKDEKNRGLEFTIVDIPKTVENGKKVWANLPGTVNFVAGDFLAPDVDASGIPKGSPTYLIRHVLHDWTDSEVVRILTNVRDAMAAAADQAPTLLVCEMLLREDSSRFVRTTSMQLLALNNGITRTQDAMIALLEQAGLEVKHVHHMRAVDSIIEAVLPARS
ncbi:S-adenosyl-L-methionine-dependent methyltransferase [Auricularia subglabra TFB-10046 SS5]|uniref:S-adenosyl-L-methionine-dependent methyltransferase n=1 Tax=Auricularia subglabra (strain TFB-10046 / SS5) TaxID=717982 RepID=J0D165_AURST|nr:S-adenosyl-L-methionine-dependent methyltransferase [Auricularia subglabra TFB-10046 SS5]